MYDGYVIKVPVTALVSSGHPQREVLPAVDEEHVCQPKWHSIQKLGVKTLQRLTKVLNPSNCTNANHVRILVHPHVQQDNMTSRWCEAESDDIAVISILSKVGLLACPKMCGKDVPLPRSK